MNIQKHMQLTDHEFQTLKSLCEKTGMKQHQLLRQILKDHLASVSTEPISTEETRDEEQRRLDEQRYEEDKRRWMEERAKKKEQQPLFLLNTTRED